MDVRLDETKVTLNCGTNVLHPLDGAFLMGGDRASSESIALLVDYHHLGSKHLLRFNILVDHLGLMVIGGVFSGLRNPYGKPASGRIGIKRGTSFKASIEFLRGPEKSPYSIVRLTLLPSTSISCTVLADG
jgi:hypothetical protein